MTASVTAVASEQGDLRTMQDSDYVTLDGTVKEIMAGTLQCFTWRA